MNIETKHALLDLREGIDKDRDQDIVVAKQDYLDAVSNARQVMKDAIVDIKATHRRLYILRKAELIKEDEV